jgi:hypothetical protein
MMRRCDAASEASARFQERDRKPMFYQPVCRGQSRHATTNHHDIYLHRVFYFISWWRLADREAYVSEAVEVSVPFSSRQGKRSACDRDGDAAALVRIIGQLM